MLKARSGNVLIMGLSKLNIQKLQEGKPIVFDGKEFGHKMVEQFKFVIMAGETEETIYSDILKSMDGDTSQ